MRWRCSPPVSITLYCALSILGWWDLNGSETVELGGKVLNPPEMGPEAATQLPSHFHDQLSGSHDLPTTPLRTGLRNA